MLTSSPGATLQKSLQQALEADRIELWEGFVREAHGVIASAIVRVLSRGGRLHRDQIEDIIQETFLKLCSDDFRLLRRFRSDRPEALVAYLRTVASSVAVDAQRVGRAQKRGSGKEALVLEDVPLADATRNPIEEIERKLLFSRIGRCLAEQKDRDRHIFWLYYRHGLTSQAISAIKALELSSSGVESSIRRLTATVRKCLKLHSAGGMPQTPKGNLA
jgi:RNA polymerase sigma factor (sigma-70 family)